MLKRMGLFVVGLVLTGLGLPGAWLATAVVVPAAMTVAVRQALDFESTARALAVCAIGWILIIGIAFAAGLMFGPSLA